MSKDWIVDRILISTEARKYGANVFYPYHVIGRYSAECTVNGQTHFSWTIPASSLDNPRYDLTQVTEDQRIQAAEVK